MEQQDRERSLIRDLNVTLVADLIRRYQPVSRVELAERSHLGRSTITGIVNALIQHGLVAEVGEAESTGGRKPVLLELSAAAPVAVSVRLTPRTVTMALVDVRGQVAARHRRGLRGQFTPAEVLGQVCTWVEEMLRESLPAGVRVAGAGLLLPGRVRHSDGTLLESALLGWSQVPVAAYLAERLSISVLADSDANGFVQGERLHGAGQMAESLIGVVVGAGVRAGLIVDGHVCRGTDGGVGELGHLPVAADGPPCYCGLSGCLEAMVSDGALAAQALLALDRGADSLLLDMVEGRRQAIHREVIVAAAQDGDRLCRRLLEQAGHRIGQVTAQAANLLQPRVAVFGGEAVEQAGSLLLEPIREAMSARTVSWNRDTMRVEAAVLGESAWLAGAADLVWEQAFRPPLHRTDTSGRPSVAAWIPEGA